MKVIVSSVLMCLLLTTSVCAFDIPAEPGQDLEAQEEAKLEEENVGT